MIDARTRRLGWRRANAMCEYCHFPHGVEELDFEVDHIIALKHGGASTLDNLCLACFYCNSYKGANLSGIDPKTGQTVPLFHPRRQKWERHFAWDGVLLVGRTRSGRATISVLNINDEYAIAVRQSLMHEGLFPAVHGG